MSFRVDPESTFPSLGQSGIGDPTRPAQRFFLGSPQAPAEGNSPLHSSFQSLFSGGAQKQRFSFVVFAHRVNSGGNPSPLKRGGRRPGCVLTSAPLVPLPWEGRALSHPISATMKRGPPCPPLPSKGSSLCNCSFWEMRERGEWNAETPGILLGTFSLSQRGNHRIAGIPKIGGAFREFLTGSLPNIYHTGTLRENWRC